MTNKQKELLEQIAEEHNASVSFEENNVEIEHYSDQGEDLVFNVCDSDIVNNLKDVYDGFDPDEHAVENYHAYHMDLQNLLTDAKAIDEWLEEFVDDVATQFAELEN